MPGQDDPFELLRKKLEARKKSEGQPSAADRGRSGSPGRAQPSRSPKAPAPPKPLRAVRRKRPSRLDSKSAGGASKSPDASRKRPSAQGFRIIRNAWSREDLERMEQSRETASGKTPEGFESHRYDSGLDPKMRGGAKKGAKEPIRRPKGFQSDRHDS